MKSIRKNDAITSLNEFGFFVIESYLNDDELEALRRDFDEIIDCKDNSFDFTAGKAGKLTHGHHSVSIRFDGKR